jgi:neutral ceramidase
MKCAIQISCVAGVLLLVSLGTVMPVAAAGLRVGAAAVDLQAEDSMVIAGGIGPGYAKGQEGKLRAVAVVIEKPSAAKVAIVSVDVLMLTRDLLDPVVAEIERDCGIPAAHVLIHTTHTHHAPSTVRVHGYDRDEVFCRRVQQAVVRAVKQANADLVDGAFHFHQGKEETVGQNSRLLLSDGTIYWVGPRDDVVRPTGPFDSDLPVLAFRCPAGRLLAVLFGHSTHTIGGLTGGMRSPAFYGMAAQRMEADLGGVFAFLQGASGSTHRFEPDPAEASRRIEAVVRDALSRAQPQAVAQLAAIKKPFTFRVRTFDEAAEERAVTDYCIKRLGGGAAGVIEVFRTMRRELAPLQGQERTTWIQAIRLGDVAIVGVPAEFFTSLGADLKRRSPLPHTMIAELSNDWIGYLPDREAHELGGYQVWTGFHSYAEPGTGERLVDKAVQMLQELAGKPLANGGS